MKEPAKHAGIIGGISGTAGHEVPSKTGPLVVIGELLRRLSRRESRANAVERAARPEEGRGHGPNQSLSVMDAGITGGMSLLIGGPGDKRRKG